MPRIDGNWGIAAWRELDERPAGSKEKNVPITRMTTAVLAFSTCPSLDGNVMVTFPSVATLLAMKISPATIIPMPIKIPAPDTRSIAAVLDM